MQPTETRPTTRSEGPVSGSAYRPEPDPGLEPDKIVVLDGVSKDYISGAGVVRAMREVNLTIGNGEFVAIVGTSGSGKSTMMNILGCLDRPTRGTYTLAGLDVGGRGNDARALVRNRLIGFIFQGFNLLSRTTALENVELPLQYRGIGAGERRKRAMRSLEQVGLGDRVHHTPNQLSGGQQQRVAIARALVTSPPLLLADEPTGNLDTRTSLEVLALLQALNRDEGITIILVTHEHDIAACAKRVITMRDGRIVSDVVQDRPTDAAKDLAALPLSNDKGGGLGDDAMSPLEAMRIRLGGRVPFSVFAMMFVGLLGGAVGGILYNALVLHQSAGWIPLVAAILLESWAGARFGRRRFGRALTSDQRVRLSLWYTLSLGIGFLGIAWLAIPKLPVAVLDRFDTMSSGGVAVALLVILFLLSALSLMRYLLLTLFSANAKGR